MTLRLSLWSGPRNVSTALMYSFAQRPDTRVFDEPLYAHYLVRSPARRYHPGAEEVIRSMESDGRRVVERVFLGEFDRPVLFFKNMTHHLVELDLDFLDRLVNVILTRDPHEMLPSYGAKVEEPQLRDTGYPQQAALLEELLRRGQEPIVLESSVLLQNPSSVLSELCRRVKIRFEHSMMSWPAGPRPEDGVWARYWYENVHRSNGFSPHRPKSGPFPERLRSLLDQCLPYYRQLEKYGFLGE